MKTRMMTWMVAFALAGVCTAQEVNDKEDKVIPEMNGYKSVTIRKVQPDSLSIMHESGTTKIQIEDLSEALRTEHGLTMEGATEYRKQIAANTATRRVRQQEAARKQPPATRASTPATSPKFVTSDQVKIMWVRKLPQPRSLDSNYHQIMETYRDFVAEIKAGKRDLDAQETAATYNKSLAVSSGNAELANTFEAELFRIAQAKSAAAALAQQQQQARRERADFMRLNSQLRSIDQNLRSIDATISGW